MYKKRTEPKFLVKQGSFGSVSWHPLGESNPQLTLRRGPLYPFN